MTDLFEHPTLRRAKEIWAEREKGFPKFVQQTWEQGTWCARAATIKQAEEEMERARDSRSKPVRAETVKQGSVHESGGAERQSPR